MIRSTGGVETGIIPVCVVLESPGWRVLAISVCGFEIRRTEERLHVEVVPLLICQDRALRVSCDLVEPSLVGVVSD